MPLLPTFSGRGAVVSLSLGEEAQRQCEGCTVTLRLRLEEWTPVDRVEVRWDGHRLVWPPLPPPALAAGTIIEVNHDQWLRFALDSRAGGAGAGEVVDVGGGVHRVEVILLERNPQVLSEITLTDVEVLFDYGMPPPCGLPRGAPAIAKL